MESNEMTISSPISWLKSNCTVDRLSVLKKWLATFILVIIFVPFMEWREECYPFSHFPMYSTLSGIWTLKLTDENGKYLSLQRQFTGGPNSLRKLTTARLRQVKIEKKYSKMTDLKDEDWSEACRRTMIWILENHKATGEAAKAKSLRMWREEYSSAGGKLTKKKIPLYEHVLTDANRVLPKSVTPPAATAPATPPAAPVTTKTSQP